MAIRKLGDENYLNGLAVFFARCNFHPSFLNPPWVRPLVDRPLDRPEGGLQVEFGLGKGLDSRLARLFQAQIDLFLLPKSEAHAALLNYGHHCLVGGVKLALQVCV